MLQLEVVAEYRANGYIFENLDYILDCYAGIRGGDYPNIEDYLI